MLGVGSVVCIKPFSKGIVGLTSGRFRTGIAGHAIGRNSRDPLDIDVSLGSDGGGSTQFDSDVPERPSLGREIGDEKWRHAVVVGIPPGNALWVLTPGRSIELVDFIADRLRDAKIWDGVRLPRSVPVDSAATADRSVRGVFSPGWKQRSSWLLHKRWILMLVRGSPFLNVD